MNKSQILDWVSSEFAPIQLATPDDTIKQTIDNAIRYWNTHSAFPLVRMFNYTPGGGLQNVQGATTGYITLTPDYSQVAKVYPSQVPDWILGNYPLWSLLGITVIDNLTSDLIMLSEAYRNYRYYMGTDFTYHFEKSDNPAVGGKLYLSSVPNGTTNFAVVGTKRILNGDVTENFTVTLNPNAGATSFYPITQDTFSITNGVQIFTDNGDGTLSSSISGYSGTINYTTGTWTVTGWSTTTTSGTMSYNYEEDIKSEFILSWLLYYIKALVKMVEGNALRKMEAIAIRNDGQQLLDEGKEEKKELEQKLMDEGRWFAFCRKF